MKSPLIGKEMRLRTGVTAVGDLRVKVLRCSPIGTLTVELLEGRGAYQVGNHLHVQSYEVEPLSLTAV